MNGMATSPDGAATGWVQPYLDFLGLAHEAPGLDALTRLTRAHVLRVPFESVTSVLRRSGSPVGPVPPLDADVLLDAWIAGRSGGLCFEITHVFGRLLDALGYRCHPVLAFITFPGSHQAVLVELDGRRYLVDAGNGAPLFEPTLLDGTVEVSRFGLAYRYRAGRRRQRVDPGPLDRRRVGAVLSLRPPATGPRGPRGGLSAPPRAGRQLGCRQRGARAVHGRRGGVAAQRRADPLHRRRQVR